MPLSNPVLKQSNDIWLHVETQGPTDQGHEQLMELVWTGSCVCMCVSERGESADQTERDGSRCVHQSRIRTHRPAKRTHSWKAPVHHSAPQRNLRGFCWKISVVCLPASCFFLVGVVMGALFQALSLPLWLASVARLVDAGPSGSLPQQPPVGHGWALTPLWNLGRCEHLNPTWVYKTPELSEGSRGCCELGL